MKDMQHPGVIVKDVGCELDNSAFSSHFQQLVKHRNSPSLSLQVIAHNKGNFGSICGLVNRVPTDHRHHLVLTLPNDACKCLDTNQAVVI